jgi:hypothetical protein
MIGGFTYEKVDYVNPYDWDNDFVTECLRGGSSGTRECIA